MKKLSELGELGLIQRIEKRCPSKKIRGVHVCAPLGDDAFVAKMASNIPLVITTDTLIEGTHYNFKWLSPFLNRKEQWSFLGYKSMAVNLSDLAAMGHVQPLFAFISLGLSGDIPVDSVDNLYTEIEKLAKKHHFTIAGGDTFRSDKSIVSITIIGKIVSGSIVKRSGAQIGDILMLSGPIGHSAAGMEIIKKGLKIHNYYLKELVYAHLYPVPKMKEGRILSNRDILASAMMDTSDDLAASLEILSRNSSVGFEVELDKIPLSEALQKISKQLKVSPYRFIIYGGEDYQLLFTVPASKIKQVKKRIPSAYAFGVVRPKSFGVQLKMNGRPFHLKDCRFQHFK